MVYLDGPIFVGALGVLQIAGLASACLARLSEGSPREASCQWIFFALLALTGGATMTTFALGTGHWLSPGTTLSVMVLAAIWDFRAHRPRPVG
jgi:hypothetical protein